MGESQERSLTSLVHPELGQTMDKQGYMVFAAILIAISVIFFFLSQQVDFSFGEILTVFGFAAFFLIIGGLTGAKFFSRNGSDGNLIGKFADSLEDSVLITDRMGRIFYANQSYADLTGAENISSVRSIERVFSGFPDASESMFRLAQSVRERHKSNELIRLPQRLSRSDDGARWYRIRVWHLDSQTQSFLSGGKYVVWQIADVTEQQEEEEGNFIGFQRVIDLLDEFPTGFFTCDKDGRLQYMNKTLAKWLGLESFQHSEPVFLSDIVRGDSKDYLRILELSDSEPRTENFDLDLVCRDGKNLAVRILNQCRISTGSFQQDSFLIVVNRSTGEESVEALHAVEAKFNRLFNNTPIAIATLRRNGEIGRTNSKFQKLFESFQGRSDVKQNLMTLIPAESGEKLNSTLKAVFEGVNEGPVEIALTERKDGPSASVFVATVEDGEADDDVFIVYILETTQQRALEVQFAQSQKMQAIGHLAGGIAHDFNNILTTILGAADFLLSNHRETDPSFKDIMSIKQDASKAASLVKHLLAFSRRQTLLPSEIQLKDVLDEVVNMLGRLLSEKINLTIHNGRDLWPVLVDSTQFGQAIINLAVNANDAMPEGGELSIRTANVPSGELGNFGGAQEMPEGDYVLIEIKDNGQGMTPEVIEQIFEPFFTTKDVGQGTGLGLSMVYGMIKQTGGYIYPESELGEGTKFRIFLPRCQEKRSEIAEKEVQDAQSTLDLTGSASILLVEDEDSVRTFAKRALESRGYSVFQAANGAEALEVFSAAASEIDLVVSDVVMPEMDGPTLLGELRRISPDIKVIFVSGYAEEAFEKNLPEKEEFSFLSKPFTLKQLATTVKEVLNGN